MVHRRTALRSSVDLPDKLCMLMFDRGLVGMAMAQALHILRLALKNRGLDPVSMRKLLFTYVTCLS